MPEPALPTSRATDAASRLRARLSSDRRGLPPAPPGPAPLTATQAGLWFDHRRDPDDPAGHRPTVFRVSGPVEAPALVAAIDAVVDRHTALRTSYPMVDGHPVQVVHEPSPPAAAVVDLRGVDRAETDRRVQELVADAARRPFPLESSPPLAVTLVRLDDDVHLIVLAVHHLSIDGPSADRVLRDLASALDGSEPAPSPSTFADWATWSTDRVSVEDRDGQLAWWHRVLAPPLPPGPDAAPRTPSSEPTSSAPGHEPADPWVPDELRPVRVELSSARADGLRAVARSTSVTTFAALLAAVQATLLDAEDRDDVVLAMPITNRHHPDAEAIVGCGISVLPLRLRIGPGDTGRTLMARAGATVISALDHRGVALSEILVATVPRRRDGRARSPIIGTVQLVPPSPVVRLDAGVVVERVPVTVPPEGFGLVVTDDGTSLVLEASVPVERGGRVAASRFVDALVAHIDRLVAAPDALLRPVIEDRVDDATGADPSALGPPDETVGERFVRIAQEHADLPAVEHGDRVLTYGELEQQARQLADRLRAEGIGPGHTVGIDLDRSLECVVAMVGVVLAGGVYVPLDQQSPPERTATVLADSGASVVIGPAGVARVGPPTPPQLPTEVGPRSPIYVIYTSGSTGTPKGVVVHHRGVVRLVCDTDHISFGVGDRVAFATAPAFDVTTFDVWGPLLNGGCTVVVERETILDPARLEAFLRERRITTLDVNTAVLNAIARQRPAAFASLRDLCFGGEAVEPRWVRAVLEAGPPQRLVHNYGPTETTVLATWELVEHVEADAVTVPIGRPIAHTTLHLLDEHRRPVPAGVPGEIYVGGSRLALGYLGRDELNTERFVPDPFTPDDPEATLYRSGDLAVARTDGRLEFVGRIDTQVKVRGYRVELGEIEAALARHPGVDLVAVHPWRRDDDTVLVAYVVPAPGGPPLRDDLRLHLRSIVPPYMVPTRFVWLDRLPLNPNDKVDRTALPEPDWQVAPAGERARPLDLADGSDGAPGDDRDEVERMSKVWSTCLGLHTVDPDADFFELGGHSLVAVALLAAVGVEFGVELRTYDLVDGPTPRRLADAVRRAEQGWDGVRDGAIELAPGRPDAGLTPLVLIPPLFGVQAVADARSLVRHLDPDRRVVLLDLQGRSGREVPIDSVSGLTSFYLSQLRAVVPTGSVVLAGHSLGGAIALEMARCLDGGPGPSDGASGDAAGEPRVEVVVMVDTRVSDDEAARWLTVAKRPLRRAWHAVRSRGGRPDVEAEVKAATSRAWLTYRPRPYLGRVVYIAARGIEGSPEPLRRDEPWTPVLPAFEVHDVDGGHSGPGSLLDEPHVGATAAVLQQALLGPGALGPDQLGPGRLSPGHR